jgi:hypothetical protein
VRQHERPIAETALTMITLLTCTGDRPQLFRRLERWMARQSLRWSNWIVVDDGIRKTECSLGQQYIRLAPGLSPSASFARNLGIALQEQCRIPGSEVVFVIEDDDWYGPDYVASLFTALVTYDLVGESCSRYYNVSRQSYHHCLNKHHAALCATAFRAALTPRVISCIDLDSIYLDLSIWGQLNCSKHLQRTNHCVGLKAQVGRPGLSWGHQSQAFHPDHNGAVLKKWVGGDAVDILKCAIDLSKPMRQPHGDVSHCEREAINGSPSDWEAAQQCGRE